MKSKLLLLLILVFACALVLTACGGSQGGRDNGKFELKISEDIEDVEAVQNDVCDLSEYVETVDGYEYYLEAYQLDTMNDFAEIRLDTDGLKFTPTFYDDAYVVICAKKGSKVVKSDEITIKVVLPRDEIVERIVTAWNDPVFNVDVNTDPRYIKGDNIASAKVAFFGSEPTDADRWQYFATLTGEMNELFSVTDWSDAVLSFWVYNPTEYDIEFCPIWSHNGAEFYANRDPRTFRVAKPNGWTEIKYSLRYFNMTEPFFFDSDVYYGYITEQVAYGFGTAENGKPAINHNWWTCRWAGRQPVNKVYGYNFYVSGFDIRNYDAALDADIDHTLNGAKADYTFGTNDANFKFPQKVTTKDKVSFEVWAPNRGTSSVKVITDDWKHTVGPFYFDVNDQSKNSLGVEVEKIIGVEDGYKVTLDLRLGGGNVGSAVLLDALYWDGGHVETYFKNLQVIVGEEIVKDPVHPNAFLLSGDGPNVFGANAFAGRDDQIKFFYKLYDNEVSSFDFGFMLFDGSNWDNYLPIRISCDEDGLEEASDAIVSATPVQNGWFEIILDLSKIKKVINEGYAELEDATWQLKTIYSNASYTNCAIYLDGFQTVDK